MHRAAFVALSAVLTAFAPVREAQAVCDPSQLCARPAPAPCSISGTWTIDDGCDLDFTGRDVAVASNGTLDIGSGTVTIRADDFTVLAGGFIDGRPGGGVIAVLATGDIVVQQSLAGIDVAGSSQGGGILLDAGGDIRIEGRLRAHNTPTTPNAAGGYIVLRAGRDIDITSSSAVDASGGSFSSGGDVDLRAGGSIMIAKDLTVSGGDGGTIEMIAGDELVILGKLQSNGDNGGEGGFIELTAENNVTIGETVQSRGSGVGEFGGDGGEITITSTTADVYIRAELTVRSGVPDGAGGNITVMAGGSIEVQPPGTLRAHGDGIDSLGGLVELLSDVDVILDGAVDAYGGDAGDVDIAAGRDIRIMDIEIDAAARTTFGLGGTVFVDAAQTMSGHVDINGTIDAGAAQCLVGFCGIGGDIDVTACDLTIGPGGKLLVDGPGVTGEGGRNMLAARRQLRVMGTLDATGLGRPGGNFLVFPSLTPPVLAGAITPPPSVRECTEATCTDYCRPFCERFCDCGNESIDQFEQCDTAPAGCDVASGEVCGVIGTPLACTCIDTCGNGVVDAGEACEAGVGQEQNCLALGYANDLPAPCVNCAIDTSDCDPGFCGDGIIATARGEVCEPGNLNGASCASEGFTRGQLACQADCLGVDTSGCEMDDYKCYKTRARFDGSDITLEDQFGSARVTVVRPLEFCNPVERDGVPILDPVSHLNCYKIQGEKFAKRRVAMTNDFGEQTMTVVRAQTLCLPAGIDPQQANRSRGFKCYRVGRVKPFSRTTTNLDDVFENKDTIVIKPIRICTPVNRDDGDPLAPLSPAHLTCFKIKDVDGQPRFQPRAVDVIDDFINQQVTTVQRTDCRRSRTLCLPSLKRLASPSGAFVAAAADLFE